MNNTIQHTEYASATFGSSTPADGFPEIMDSGLIALTETYKKGEND